MLKPDGEPVAIRPILRPSGQLDTRTSDLLQAKLEKRPVMDCEQPFGDMDAIIGIDTDQVRIERGMVDFRQRQPIGDHRLPVLLIGVHHDVRGIEQRKPRVLVGADAAALSVLARIAPVRYWKVLAGRMGK